MALVVFTSQSIPFARRVGCAIALLLLSVSASRADEQELEDKPAASSIEEFESPIERSHAAPAVVADAMRV